MWPLPRNQGVVQVLLRNGLFLGEGLETMHVQVRLAQLSFRLVKLGLRRLNGHFVSGEFEVCLGLGALRFGGLKFSLIPAFVELE